MLVVLFDNIFGQMKLLFDCFALKSIGAIESITINRKVDTPPSLSSTTCRVLTSPLRILQTSYFSCEFFHVYAT